MFRLRIHTDLGFEVWQDIPGYEGYYQDSTYGRVKSLERKVKFHKEGEYRIVPERILKQCEQSNGYLSVNLYKDGKMKTFKVHRLIASTFIFNPNNYGCINHKDENPKNNRVDNIEYCTQCYNINYGTRNERVSGSLSKPIVQCDKDNVIICEWKSIKDACDNNIGYKRANITDCLYGRQKTSYGYIWKFKEDA